MRKATLRFLARSGTEAIYKGVRPVKSRGKKKTNTCMMTKTFYELVDSYDKYLQVAKDSLPSINDVGFPTVSIPVFIPMPLMRELNEKDFVDKPLLSNLLVFEFEKDVLNGVIIGWKLKK